MALVRLNHLTLTEHVSSSVLVRVFVGILLSDMESRRLSSTIANYHELTLFVLPAFVRVTSSVVVRIVLLWSTTAFTGSGDNLAFTKTFMQRNHLSEFKDYASPSSSRRALWNKFADVIFWLMPFCGEEVHSTFPRVVV